MSREYPQYKLRMSPELKEAINNLAIENNRSMNAEIVARLEASIAREDASSVRPIRVSFDEDLLDEAGLTKEQFGAFVRKSILDGLKDKGSD